MYEFNFNTDVTTAGKMYGELVNNIANITIILF